MFVFCSFINILWKASLSSEEPFEAKLMDGEAGSATGRATSSLGAKSEANREDFPFEVAALGVWTRPSIGISACFASPPPQDPPKSLSTPLSSTRGLLCLRAAAGDATSFGAGSGSSFCGADPAFIRSFQR